MKLLVLVVFAALALAPDLVVASGYDNPMHGHGQCMSPWWKEVSSGNNDAASINGANAAYPDRSGPIDAMPAPSAKASRLATLRELIFGANHQHQPFFSDSFDQ